MKRILLRVSQSWDHFWFRPLDLLPACLFRLIFGTLLFFFYSIRFSDRRYLFLEEGLLNNELRSWINDVLWQKNGIPWGHFIQGYEIITIAHVILLILIACLAVGLLNRLGTFLLLLLHLCFLEQGSLTNYGADSIATCFLIALTLIRSNQYLRFPSFSISKKSNNQKASKLSSVGIRLIQLQVCIIYTYAGFDKLTSEAWRNGLAIWSALAYFEPHLLPLEPVQYFPMVTVLATYMTVLWEVYFAVLVWLKQTRTIVLTIGLLMHLGIGATMGLWFFSGFLCSSYLLWTNVRSLSFISEK